MGKAPIARPMASEGEIQDAVGAVAGGRVSRVRVDGDRASLIVDATGLDGNGRAALEADLRRALTAVPGIAAVRVAMTAARADRVTIAIASGKGGVGKSTLTANIAVALRAAGRRVGLVDADIYGPSQPRLLGAEGVKPVAHEKRLVPVATASGVPLLSMGQLVPADGAIAWRGPMVAGALTQLMDADWGFADTLLVDMPPGTGDVQLTMIQKHRPAGAVIVSTPQDLALIDARRAIDLFAKAGVPIIGLVENMAGYACPHCGEVSDPFGRGGAEAAATEMGIAFLGRVPLTLAIRTASDAGTLSETAAFTGIAARVAAWIEGTGHAAHP